MIVEEAVLAAAGRRRVMRLRIVMISENDNLSDTVATICEQRLIKPSVICVKLLHVKHNHLNSISPPL